jgi:hypothetical protein
MALAPQVPDQLALAAGRDGAAAARLKAACVVFKQIPYQIGGL